MDSQSSNGQKAALCIPSRSRREFIDITAEIRRFINNARLDSGTVMVWCPHTTAAITVNENADPDVPKDILHYLEKAVPAMPAFRHAEGNSPAHIMASLLGPGLLLLVEGGVPLLGRWQGVFLCEFDGPRTRNVLLRVISRVSAI